MLYRAFNVVVFVLLILFKFSLSQNCTPPLCPLDTSNINISSYINPEYVFAYGQGIVGGLVEDEDGPELLFCIQLVDSCGDNITNADDLTVLVDGINVFNDNNTLVTQELIIETSGNLTNLTFIGEDEGKLLFQYTSFQYAQARLDISMNDINSTSNSTPIFSSPFYLDFIQPSYCPFWDGPLIGGKPNRTSTKPKGGLPQCSYYSENACCYDYEIENFNDIIPNYAEVIADLDFDENEDCLAIYDVLACGLLCSPSQETFLEIYDGDNDTSGNDTLSEYRICKSFADRIFNACGSVIVGECQNCSGSIDSFLNDSTLFMNLISPDLNFEIVVIDDNATNITIGYDCFNGLVTETTNSFIELVESDFISIYRREKIIAGVVTNIEIQTFDINFNPSQTSILDEPLDLLTFNMFNNSNITNIFSFEPVNSTNPPAREGSGVWYASFMSTTAELMELIVSMGGEPVGFYEIEVIPASISASGSYIINSLSLIVDQDTIESFIIQAADEFGNIIFDNGNTSFYQLESYHNGTLVPLNFTVTDLCDGLYEIEYVVPLIPGNYSIVLFGQNSTIDEQTHDIIVLGVPCPLNCSGNGICVSGICDCDTHWEGIACEIPILCLDCSVAFGPGIAPTNVLGIETWIGILSKNELGEIIDLPNLEWEVEIISEDGKVVVQNLTDQVFHQGFGEHRVFFTPNALGVFNIYITLGGEPIGNGPFQSIWLDPLDTCGCCNNAICLFPNLTTDPTAETCVCLNDFQGPDCCTPPDLRIIEILFSDVGSAILINFNADTNMGGMFGEDDCSIVINDTSTFGDDNFCVWQNERTLSIWLGSNATVEVGDFIFFINGSIEALSDSADNKRSISHNFQNRMVFLTNNDIRAPMNPVIPCAMVSAPQRMNPCGDSLIFDASLSVGSGGRDMIFNWELVYFPSKASFQNAELFIKAHLAFEKSYIVTFNDLEVKNWFESGYEYTFSLSVTNHFNISSTKTFFSVEFSFDPIPVVSVEPSYITTTADRPLKFHASAKVSDCSESIYIDYEEEEILEQTWIQTGGIELNGDFDVTQVNLDTTNNPVIFNSPGLFLPGSYEMQFRAAHRSFRLLRSDFDLKINVERKEPFANVLGGIKRRYTLQRDRNIPLIIDASNSIDFDGYEDDFTFIWECEKTTWKEPCFTGAAANTYLINSPILEIPPYEFDFSETEWTLSISKPNGLTSTTSFIIETIGSGPIVSIEVQGLNNRDGKINRRDGLVLQTIIDADLADGNLNFIWTQIGGAPGVLDDISFLASPLNAPSLVIKPNVLAQNQTLTFRVDVSNNAGTGFAIATIKVNDRPTGGYCSVKSDDPHAAYSNSISFLTHGLEIECINWEDNSYKEDIHLWYQYFVDLDGRRVPLHSGQEIVDSIEFYLPDGEFFVDVEIHDQLGAQSDFRIGPIETKITIEDFNRYDTITRSYWLMENVVRRGQNESNGNLQLQGINLILNELSRGRTSKRNLFYKESLYIRGDGSSSSGGGDGSSGDGGSGSSGGDGSLLNNGGPLGQFQDLMSSLVDAVNDLPIEDTPDNTGIITDVLGEIVSDPEIILPGTLELGAEVLSNLIEGEELKGELAESALESSNLFTSAQNTGPSNSDEETLSITKGFSETDNQRIGNKISDIKLQIYTGIVKGQPSGADPFIHITTKGNYVEVTKDFLTGLPFVFTVGNTGIIFTITEEVRNYLGNDLTTIAWVLGVEPNDPYNFSPSAENISTNVAEFIFFKEHPNDRTSFVVEDINIPNAITIEFPINFGIIDPLDHLDDFLVECVYWNGLEYSTDGCSLINFERDSVTCQCDHLTQFAVSITPTGLLIPPPGTSPTDLLPSGPDEETSPFLHTDEILILILWISLALFIILCVVAGITYRRVRIQRFKHTPLVQNARWEENPQFIRGRGIGRGRRIIVGNQEDDLGLTHFGSEEIRDDDFDSLESTESGDIVDRDPSRLAKMGAEKLERGQYGPTQTTREDTIDIDIDHPEMIVEEEEEEEGIYSDEGEFPSDDYYTDSAISGGDDDDDDNDDDDDDISPRMSYES